jgi:hypothetical protein
MIFVIRVWRGKQSLLRAWLTAFCSFQPKHRVPGKYVYRFAISERVKLI